ncbi:hypothetical protein N9C24_04890 [Gammaproteobacteria bacterium]|nr:hypothetical protein [Gammaproteobacteria bacterium]
MIGTEYSGIRQTLVAISKHNDIPLIDMTKMDYQTMESLTIRDIIVQIMKTPLKCMILVRISSTDDKMYKVVQRLYSSNIGSSRVIFCSTMDKSLLPIGIDHDDYPGSIDDRISMLLYLVPSKFANVDRLEKIAQSIRDYCVFQMEIPTDGTIDEYFCALQYQITKRVELDTRIDDFPTHEVEWRRSLSSKLKNELYPRPVSVSDKIHRVLPIGTALTSDIVDLFQTILPDDLDSSYVLSVAKEASDQDGGSIFITDRTRHISAKIKCSVDFRHEYHMLRSEVSMLKRTISELKEIVYDKVTPKRKCIKDDICNRRGCYNPVGYLSNGKLRKRCTKCTIVSNRKKISK